MTERIGPYLIDSRLGVGGMGVVHAAHDEALERPVALKVISPQLADDAEFRARFVREAARWRRWTRRTWCRSTPRTWRIFLT